MEFNSWLVFASIIALASISPGPNEVAVVVHTLDAGARGAISTIMGNLLALFTIAGAAAIGVGALLHAAPNVFMAMKIAGGIYLAWMGIKQSDSARGVRLCACSQAHILAHKRPPPAPRLLVALCCY